MVNRLHLNRSSLVSLTTQSTLHTYIHTPVAVSTMQGAICSSGASAIHTHALTHEWRLESKNWPSVFISMSEKPKILDFCESTFILRGLSSSRFHFEVWYLCSCHPEHSPFFSRPQTAHTSTHHSPFSFLFQGTGVWMHEWQKHVGDSWGLQAQTVWEQLTGSGRGGKESVSLVHRKTVGTQKSQQSRT